MSLARLAWPALKVWLGLTSRDHFKALLIARLFPDAPVARLKQLGREHASHIASLCRPAALNQIKWHQDQGHHLIMVSASLDFYLEPLARQLGFKNLLCTEVASCNGVCTGQIRGENCRASAKVRRLEELLGPLHQYEIHAYGDSDGDAEMLAISDHPAFKPFRKAR
ncbi:HAD-superfamily subfamily IB hydrolase, TIGR01490 [Andreprevotia lacus DSM 23236]|jgi:HAD superfamily hydrolase (TIGR01490 family)|uniref:HAD-superfamily subfamily IB hydrolase, TIGR01490 n=2 Tax=Andreprevotia TaxID=397275 RepID=A0A1W1XWY6_9NEIS|nr:HAD-superfamily subfamily IB hydrolase, TIGR01490 [Andreprevotia lacus DSM 23236]